MTQITCEKEAPTNRAYDTNYGVDVGLELNGKRFSNTFWICFLDFCLFVG